MTAYYGSSQVSGTFQGSSSYLPLVGVLLSKYENYSNLDQFVFNATDNAVAGDPVTILNKAASSVSSEPIEQYNAVCGEITAIATAISNLDGFLLQSPQDVVPSIGGEAKPQSGFLTMAALLGSGAELYLPADTSLSSVDYNTRVTWDFDNDVLRKAVVGTDIALPIRIKSALVKAKKLTYSEDTGLATWGDCTAVLVSLDSNIQTIESSGS